MNTTVAGRTRHSTRPTCFWGFVTQLNSLELAHSVSGSDYKGEDLLSDITNSSIDTDEDDEDGDEEDGWNILILEHINN
jgi:hypothetical protein